jgi:hypothetical protein
MRFDVFEAFKIISNPEGEGVPYLCRQILGTDKGNAVAPVVLKLIDSAKGKSLEEILALVAAITQAENAPEQSNAESPVVS